MNDKAAVAVLPFATKKHSEPQPQALIGSKLRIKGELYGEEDILVQGQVEGTIEVKDNNLTIGTEGKVHAD